MIYDIILIVIFLISIILGCRRGAAKTLINIVFAFLSYTAAIFLSDYLSNLIYNNYIKEKVVSSASSFVSQLGISSASQNISDAVSNLPITIKAAFAFTNNDLSQTVLDAVKEAPQKALQSVESAIAPIVTAFLSFLLSILLFIIISFLLRFLIMRPLLKIFKLPILKQVNIALGGILGAGEAVLIVSFLAYLIKILIPYIGEKSFVLSESTIYNSYIFYYFYSGNIFSEITSFILGK